MAKLTLFFHNRIVLLYQLEGKVACIGRDGNCEITINSLAVAKRHAWVTPQGNDYEISPAEDDALVLVNHQPVKSCLLQHGDLIQIGKYTLSFAETAFTPDFTPQQPSAETRVTRMPEPHPAGDADDPPAYDQLVNKGCIQVVSGAHVGKIISLYPPLVRLGLTGKECAMVSRRRDGYYLSFLEGENPPLVEGQSIGERSVLLQNGDMIRLDGIEMRFYEDTAQAADIQPDTRRHSFGGKI